MATVPTELDIENEHTGFSYTAMCYVFTCLPGVVLALIGYLYHRLKKVPKVPTIPSLWWGAGTAPETPLARPLIRRFRINVSDDELQDLKARLQRTAPFHPSMTGVGQHYGVHSTVLESVLQYWRHQYRWRERETFLNQYPQYKVNIQGLNIHFLHVRPRTKKAIPLLMVHGWAGSVREFYDMVPILTTQQPGRRFAFELVIPSLPGLGFSDGPSTPGLSATHIAVIFKNLMDALNIAQFYAHGGDWGGVVVQRMASLYPRSVLGVHSNFCFVNTVLSAFKLCLGRIIPGLVYTSSERRICNGTSNSWPFLMEEAGYFYLQATKPDTVGVALRDSPMGLAAYILEKFSTLTNPAFRDLEDGGLTRMFTMNQLLDNIMIYWISKSITSSMRIYSELFTNIRLELTMEKVPIKVPSGCARFPNEILLTPRYILQDKHKQLIHLTDHDEGGHFAAMERPAVLAEDICQFVRKARSR
ncbi:juvenile hormone epoxide hydrolase 2-like isoform X2 [Cylas formicarius]|uniref:juvenile hormone epoxide hydrolase 2-like isoform X2 n=1 Tax=Cylas formicarius TaxID=197179 RepID=UPI0029583EF1|nr:juvenile hormone epoxide hydrolase 2-like isoform X2 [Cylas formicarius]